MQDCMSILTGRIGDMYPTIVAFVDQLVKVEITFSNQIEQLAIQCRRSDCNIGSFPLLMLAGGNPSNCFIQYRASVPAVHRDGAPPCLTDRIEQVIDQRCQFNFNSRRGSVINALLMCCVRLCQFVDGKIFHLSTVLAILISTLPKGGFLSRHAVFSHFSILATASEVRV